MLGVQNLVMELDFNDSILKKNAKHCLTYRENILHLFGVEFLNYLTLKDKVKFLFLTFILVVGVVVWAGGD